MNKITNQREIYNKKEIYTQGAFYTPLFYVRYSVELIRKAIKDIVNKGNDYILLDRCGGVGNLESLLTDEELLHTIITTLEEKEWNILNEKFKSNKQNEYGQYSKFKLIIPHINSLSEEFLFGKKEDLFTEDYEINKYVKVIKEIVRNPRINIIMYENPPFRNITAGFKMEKNKCIDVKEERKERKNSLSHLYSLFDSYNLKGSIKNDIINYFILTALHFYLKKENDYYILYNPFNIQFIDILNKFKDKIKFMEGFNLCNNEINNKEWGIDKYNNNLLLCSWKRENNNSPLNYITLKKITDTTDDRKININIGKMVNKITLSKYVNNIYDTLNITDGLEINFSRFRGTTNDNAFCMLLYNRDVALGGGCSKSFKLPLIDENIDKDKVYYILSLFLVVVLKSRVGIRSLYKLINNREENINQFDYLFIQNIEKEKLIKDKSLLCKCYIWSILSILNRTDYGIYTDEILTSYITFLEKENILDNRDKYILKEWKNLKDNFKSLFNVEAKNLYDIYTKIKDRDYTDNFKRMYLTFTKDLSNYLLEEKLIKKIINIGE